jgi:acetyl-CoA synthetase
MSSLKAICTTGEPWNRDPYLWLFEHVGGGRVPIVNESGGTEVGACFLATCVTEPVKPVALGFPRSDRTWTSSTGRQAGAR